MPFRERVARRFGETVSASHSTSQPDHDYYDPHMTPALPFVQDSLPTPPCTPHHHYSDPADGCDTSPDEHDCVISVADPRAGLALGRPAGHGRPKKNTHVGGKGREPSSGQETEALVREALRPQPRRSERIAKVKHAQAKNAKAKSAKNSGSTERPKEPGSRQVAASTGSASRSTRSATSFQNFLDTSDAGQWGGRVTRSCSKMTDGAGKQLSPTSPYLSCKWFASLSCCVGRRKKTNTQLCLRLRRVPYAKPPIPTSTRCDAPLTPK